MGIQEEVFHLFKNYDYHNSSYIQFTEQLCAVLNKGLNGKLTVDYIYISFDPLRPSIDSFLDSLIGGTAMENYELGLEIGRMVKREFPHYFSGNRCSGKSGNC